MVDGFVATNPDGDAQALRDLLWGTIEDIDLTGGESGGDDAKVVRLPSAA